MAGLKTTSGKVDKFQTFKNQQIKKFLSENAYETKKKSFSNCYNHRILLEISLRKATDSLPLLSKLSDSLNTKFATDSNRYKRQLYRLQAIKNRFLLTGDSSLLIRVNKQAKICWRLHKKVHTNLRQQKKINKRRKLLLDRISIIDDSLRITYRKYAWISNAFTKVSRKLKQYENSLFLQEVADRRVLRTFVLFSVIVFLMPVVYYIWFKGTNHLNSSFSSTYTSFSRRHKHYFTENFFESLYNDVNEYFVKSRQLWNSILIKSLLFFLAVVILCICYILTPNFRWFEAFVICLVIATCIYLKSIYNNYTRLLNKGFFALKILSGFDYFKSQIVKGGAYCLYLRNFSSETPLEDTNDVSTFFSDFFGTMEDVTLDMEEGELAKMEMQKELGFNRIFFRHIKKILPVFYFANLKDKRPPNELIPIYSKNNDWFTRVCELIDNAALVIMYITDFTANIKLEYNYIVSSQYQHKTILILDQDYYDEGFSLAEGFYYVLYRNEIIDCCIGDDSSELYEKLNLKVILYNDVC